MTFVRHSSVDEAVLDYEICLFILKYLIKNKIQRSYIS